MHTLMGRWADGREGGVLPKKTAPLSQAPQATPSGSRAACKSQSFVPRSTIPQALFRRLDLHIMHVAVLKKPTVLDRLCSSSKDIKTGVSSSNLFCCATSWVVHVLVKCLVFCYASPFAVLHLFWCLAFSCEAPCNKDLLEWFGAPESICLEQLLIFSTATR